MSYDPFGFQAQPEPSPAPVDKGNRHPDTADLPTVPSFVPAGSRVAVFDNGRHVATIPANCEWYEADPWTGKIVRHIQAGEDLAAILEPK